MTWIFLDESGQFTKSLGERYFIITAFTISDPRRTAKKFRSWQRLKFPKEMRNQSEIKFSDVRISDDLRLRTVKFIASLDVRIRFVYLKKDNIPENYITKGGIKSGKLYTNVVGVLLEQFLPISDKEYRAFCDQRHLKGLRKFEFENTLKTFILPKLEKGSIVQIEMVDSTSNANIQIADWIAGFMAHYIENKKNGRSYYKILKNNIVAEGVEFFLIDKNVKSSIDLTELFVGSVYWSGYLRLLSRILRGKITALQKLLLRTNYILFNNKPFVKVGRFVLSDDVGSHTGLVGEMIP